MNGVSQWSKSAACLTRDRTFSLIVLPRKLQTVRGNFGDEPVYVPAIAPILGRFDSIKADDIPAGVKAEERVLYRVAVPSGSTFRTAVGGPLLKIEVKDRLEVLGSGAYDVMGVEQSPGGDGLVDYVLVAKVIA